MKKSNTGEQAGPRQFCASYLLSKRLRILRWITAWQAKPGASASCAICCLKGLLPRFLLAPQKARIYAPDHNSSGGASNAYNGLGSTPPVTTYPHALHHGCQHERANDTQTNPWTCAGPERGESTPGLLWAVRLIPVPVLTPEQRQGPGCRWTRIPVLQGGASCPEPRPAPHQGSSSCSPLLSSAGPGSSQGLVVCSSVNAILALCSDLGVGTTSVTNDNLGIVL